MTWARIDTTYIAHRILSLLTTNYFLISWTKNKKKLTNFRVYVFYHKFRDSTFILRAWVRWTLYSNMVEDKWGIKLKVLSSALKMVQEIFFFSLILQINLRSKVWALYCEIMKYPFFPWEKPNLSATEWYINFFSIRIQTWVIAQSLEFFNNHIFMQVLWKTGVWFINHFIIYTFYCKLILETFTYFIWYYKVE